MSQCVYFLMWNIPSCLVLEHRVRGTQYNFSQQNKLMNISDVLNISWLSTKTSKSHLSYDAKNTEYRTQWRVAFGRTHPLKNNPKTTEKITKCVRLKHEKRKLVRYGLLPLFAHLLWSSTCMWCCVGIMFVFNPVHHYAYTYIYIYILAVEVILWLLLFQWSAYLLRYAQSSSTFWLD